MALNHLAELPIRINWESNTPPFAQITDQIYCLIHKGQLAEGDLLPQIRNLAGQLDANPNTIARAYDALERLGVLRKRQGSGCFVTAPRLGRRSARDRIEPLRGRIEELLADAHALGISVNDLIESIRGLIPEITPPLDDVTLQLATHPRFPTPTSPEPVDQRQNLWQPNNPLVD